MASLIHTHSYAHSHTHIHTQRTHTQWHICSENQVARTVYFHFISLSFFPFCLSFSSLSVSLFLSVPCTLSLSPPFSLSGHSLSLLSSRQRGRCVCISLARPSWLSDHEQLMKETTSKYGYGHIGSPWDTTLALWLRCPSLERRIWGSISISRVPNQNGVSQAWYIVEIHHSGREPSICAVEIFWVESYLWLQDWHSNGYPARCLVLQGQCWDWSSGCQYTVTGWGRKLICYFYLSVAAHTVVWADRSLRYTSIYCWDWLVA